MYIEELSKSALTQPNSLHQLQRVEQQVGGSAEATTNYSKSYQHIARKQHVWVGGLIKLIVTREIASTATGLLNLSA